MTGIADVDVDFGSCLGFVFTLMKPYSALLSLINCHFLPEKFTKLLPRMSYSQMTSDALTLREFEEYEMPFDLFYAIKSLFSHDSIGTFHLTRRFLNRIESISRPVAISALEQMMYATTLDPSRLENDFEAAIRISSKTSHAAALSIDYCMQIRKCIVTPTRLLFLPPSAELGNRVIRKYGHLADRFLRVCFLDENMKKFLPGLHVSVGVTQHVSEVLSAGIVIGRRRYAFLAYSSSQLREHSCWFFSATENVSAASIRSWMGDFKDITSISKYAARLGQCFSSTVPVDVSHFSVGTVHDISVGKYCFSDGIGRISTSVVKYLADQLNCKGTPSAYQVFSHRRLVSIAICRFVWVATRASYPYIPILLLVSRKSNFVPACENLPPQIINWRSYGRLRTLLATSTTKLSPFCRRCR